MKLKEFYVMVDNLADPLGSKPTQPSLRLKEEIREVKGAYRKLCEENKLLRGRFKAFDGFVDDWRKYWND